MQRMVGATVLIAVAGGVMAQAPAGHTIQQDFEAATALDAGTDSAQALAAWEALGRRVKPGSRNAAIVRVRTGDALFRLGRNEEAAVALREGLAGLPESDASLRSDRARAYLLVGTLAHNTLDYAGAAKAFAEVEALDDRPTGKLRAQLAQAQVMTFTDPAGAAAALDRADALIAGGVKVDRAALSLIAQRRAELAMNRGDFAAAKTFALAAIRGQGGMTERTTTDDVPVRADAALALILAGKPDDAREYMAMTGAGRLPRGDFAPAAVMISPDCGGEANLKPEDVAVVQFSIADNGSPIAVEPVYAAGGGRVALEFADAVRGWSWPEKDVAAIPPFFRRNVRVEMRCSTAFSRPSIYSGLYKSLGEWVSGRGITIRSDDSMEPAAEVAGLRAKLASAGNNPVAQMVAAWALSRNETVSREEAAALNARALQIARQEKAPPLARLPLELAARTGEQVDISKLGAFDAIAKALLADPDYAGDPQARAAILLMQSDYVRGRDKDRRVLTLLRAIADDTRLAKDDPLRVGALVRIASAEQRLGNLAGARAAFQATGMSGDQCAVLDTVPQMKSSVGSDAFPREAMQWGFEGWTQVQFDVQPNGRTARVRTLLGYPAFVFSKATNGLVEGARFESTFRPDGAPGCGGLTRRVIFRMPG